MRSLLGSVWSSLLMLGAFACRQPASAPEAPAELVSPAPARVVPAVEPSHPFELVPADARRVVVLPSAERAAQLWERDRLAARFPKDYPRFVERFGWGGLDLLDPTMLEAAGIDSTAPLVTATLSYEHEVEVLLGRTSDQQRLLEHVRRYLPPEEPPLELANLGDARVARADRLAVVLRYGMFALIWNGGREPDPHDHGTEIALLDPASSMAHAELLARAHIDLDHDAEMIGLFDVASIRRDMEAQSERLRSQYPDPSPSPRRPTLPDGATEDRAKPPRPLGGLSDLMMTTGVMVPWVLREELAVVGFELSVDEHGVRGHAHAELAPGSALRELLRPAEPPPLPLAALGEAPLLVLSGRVDPEVAAGRLGKLLAPRDASSSPDGLAELRPLLDGRATLALMAGPAPDPKALVAPSTLVEGIAVLGVTDEARARAWLDAWVARWPGTPPKAAPEIHGYSLRSPEWPWVLWVGVLDGQLVAGTNPHALGRLADGAANGRAWAKPLAGPGSAFLAYHHRLPLLDQWGRHSLLATSERSSIDEVLEMIEFPGQALSSIPRSAKTRRLEKEYEAARRAEQESERRRFEEHALVSWNMGQGLGLTTAVVRVQEDGLSIDVAHDASVARFLEITLTMLDLVSADSAAAIERIRRGERNATEQRVHDARERALDARRKDIERALGRKSRLDPRAIR